MCFLPRRALNVSECEIARAYKIAGSTVEPIAFIVPRKVSFPSYHIPHSSLQIKLTKTNKHHTHTHTQSDSFQSDIYPPAPSSEPALTAPEFFAGKNAPPKLVSLEDGTVFSASQAPPTAAAVPPSSSSSSSLGGGAGTASRTTTAPAPAPVSTPSVSVSTPEPAASPKVSDSPPTPAAAVASPVSVSRSTSIVFEVSLSSPLSLTQLIKLTNLLFSSSSSSSSSFPPTPFPLLSPQDTPSPSTTSTLPAQPQIITSADNEVGVLRRENASLTGELREAREKIRSLELAVETYRVNARKAALLLDGGV